VGQPAVFGHPTRLAENPRGDGDDDSHPPRVTSSTLVVGGGGARGRGLPPPSSRLAVSSRSRAETDADAARAGRRVPLSARRPVVEAAASRAGQSAAMVSAAPDSGLGAAALHRLRDVRMRDVTAASYGWAWARFVSFCSEGRYRPLPASAETVGRYVAYFWLRGSVQPTRARTYPVWGKPPVRDDTAPGISRGRVVTTHVTPP